MEAPLLGISSMATRLLLAELAAAWQRASGDCVKFESVGGVDARKRVEAGDEFDVVVLADDAIEQLGAAGHVLPESRRPLVQSALAAAMREGAPVPDLASDEALCQTLLATPRIGYSTGPSGTALLALFERWGLSEALRSRLVQARPGVPVGSLVASGEVDLGFQQLSELLHLPGLTLLPHLPPGAQIVTTFSGAVCARSSRPQEAARLLEFLQSPAGTEIKNRHGMAPA